MNFESLVTFQYLPNIFRLNDTVQLVIIGNTPFQSGIDNNTVFNTSLGYTFVLSYYSMKAIDTGSLFTTSVDGLFLFMVICYPPHMEYTIIGDCISIHLDSYYLP